MSHSPRFRSLLAGVATAGLILSTGCLSHLANEIDQQVKDLALDGPFTSSLVADGVDGSKVRAGVFAQNASGTAQAADGSQSDTQVDLEVAYDQQGKIDGYLGGADAVSLEPLQAAEIAGDSITFDLPQLDADEDLALVVWYDDDGNGALDLRADGTSENARAIERDHDGLPIYVSYYSYSASDDSYSATAVGDDNGTASNFILSRKDLDGWSVTIDHAKESGG